ncbi:hypothetical protein BKA63DRAFT_236728 [Paraphoma chrysanthemicola]|nr:hypothetical protein BKA63DRAFT_236728 [Paraphoma chrysanthemicola]
MPRLSLYDHKDTRHGLRELWIWLPIGMRSGVWDLHFIFHTLSIHLCNLHTSSSMQYFFDLFLLVCLSVCLAQVVGAVSDHGHT